MFLLFSDWLNDRVINPSCYIDNQPLTKLTMTIFLIIPVLQFKYANNLEFENNLFIVTKMLKHTEL
ncbi:hypothetical protein EGX47_04375 [Yersinia pseudotuberculosis]|uniref:Uncharacterized protein n=1 Tax=Yersinia pseudotuberculosis TaxID=633 RepID=A0ABM7AEE7_YERPU|nr:hypothetical protein EGX47_04375 [Yersinia pseudotuberculosis]